MTRLIALRTVFTRQAFDGLGIQHNEADIAIPAPPPWDEHEWDITVPLSHGVAHSERDDEPVLELEHVRHMLRELGVPGDQLRELSFPAEPVYRVDRLVSEPPAGFRYDHADVARIDGFLQALGCCAWRDTDSFDASLHYSFSRVEGLDDEAPYQALDHWMHFLTDRLWPLFTNPFSPPDRMPPTYHEPTRRFILLLDGFFGTASRLRVSSRDLQEHYSTGLEVAFEADDAVFVLSLWWAGD